MGKENLPLGIETAKTRDKREHLPALKVDNEVIWVNPEVEMPFRLDLGQSADIGLFLTDEQEKGNNQKPAMLEVDIHHNRSALLARVVFADRQGRMYRDVDLKGGGYVVGGMDRGLKVFPLITNPGDRSESGPWGLVIEESALIDAASTELFLKAGVRTNRILAVIKLKEIIYRKGERIDIAKAREIGILGEKEQPVIEVRAYTTKSRIAEASDPSKVKDGMALVSQELNLSELSKVEYFQWFCKTLGENVRIIHDLGYVHSFLTEHNITLDCKIVDLDSVTKKEKVGKDANKLRGQDISMSIKALDQLSRYLFLDFPQSEIAQIFREGYGEQD